MMHTADNWCGRVIDISLYIYLEVSSMHTQKSTNVNSNGNIKFGDVLKYNDLISLDKHMNPGLA